MNKGRARDGAQMRRRLYKLLGVGSVTAVLLLWILLTVRLPGRPGPLVNDLKLPGPMLVWQAVGQTRMKLLGYSLTTVFRVIGGLLIGSLVGVTTGMMMSRYKAVAALLDPLIEGLRPCPPVALTPFVILWLGLGTGGQILIIALASFMVLVVTTAVAIDSVERRYVRAALSLGADMPTVYRAVIWPAIIPSLISGLRVSAATAFGTTIAAEYLGAQGGLGFMIRNARTTLNTESVLLGVIIIGLESWLIDKSIRSIGRLATRWQERPFELRSVAGPQGDLALAPE